MARPLGEPSHTLAPGLAASSAACRSGTTAGLDLGLFITRQVVEALGGHVEVESELGQGALFTVELPRAKSEAPGF